MPEDDRWVLADPQFAVDFLGTLRSRGDAFTSELPTDPDATAWVREHVGPDGRTELMSLRELLRDLLTAVVDGAAPPAGAVEAVNDIAAQAPVSLAAHLAGDGAIVLERVSTGAPATTLRADLARSALTLLTEPARARLRLCRAPGCSLFFLTDLPRRQWCSADCGNRARVARHYARHSQRR